MARKRATKASPYNNVFQLEQALVDNGKAYREGPTRKKTWSKHDIKHIKALTPPQREMIHDYIEGQNIIAAGSAGTGKTFVGLYLALCDILSPDTERQRIIIVRSAVPTRDLGFTPGTVEEKAALYETPYCSMFSELIGRANTYQDMKDAGLVEFQTTSYVRGVTWDNAIVIVDEFQNMTMSELDSVITRLGRDSRLILCGDTMFQQDLKRGEKTCCEELIKVAKMMSVFSVVTFTPHDIVRSGFVKQWLLARQDA